jgi:hypothetical protein
MSDSLFATGIRPLVDKYILEKQQEYPKDYFRASSAGYCPRYVIMKRLGVPTVPERSGDVRTLRVFEAGHVFHEFTQKITKEAGVSIAQEVELTDEQWGVKGHFDDLVKVDDKLILYDIKTQNSKAFTWQKGKGISHFHRYQLGTYMMMLRRQGGIGDWIYDTSKLEEARILKISKDDLRMAEEQLLWSPQLEAEVDEYWTALKRYWIRYQEDGTLPACKCKDIDDGWFGNRNSRGQCWNDFFYNEIPCSQEWFDIWRKSNGSN